MKFACKLRLRRESAMARCEHEALEQKLIAFHVAIKKRYKFLNISHRTLQLIILFKLFHVTCTQTDEVHCMQHAVVV